MDQEKQTTAVQDTFDEEGKDDEEYYNEDEQTEDAKND